MRRCIPVAILALVTSAPQALAQREYEDPLGRFAVTLPAGWKLLSEQVERVYQFGQGNIKIVIFVQDGTSDHATAFREAVDTFTGETAPPPPEGAVFDLVVNGNAARQAQYPFEMTAGGKQAPLLFFLGVVTLEGADMSIALMSILNEKTRKKWEAEIPRVFHSLRMPGTSVLGRSEPVAVTEALAVEVKEVPASTLEHPLVTLDIPANWTAVAGTGVAIATIEHDDIQALRVLGLEGNDFGKTREAVLEGVAAGVQSALPTFNQTSPPREEATAAGGVVLIAEYEGAVVVEGREIPQWVLIGAFKEKRGGVGFLWMIPPDQKDAALDQVLGIIRSAR